METFTQWIEAHVGPIAGKIGANRYVQAIQNTFLTLIPFMTIGGLALVIITPPMDYTTMDPGIGRAFMQGWSTLASWLYQPLNTINLITMGCLAIWVAVGIAFFLARHYKMNGFLPVVVSAASFASMALINNEGALITDYFSGTGLFCAIVSSVASLELFRFLCNHKVGRIEIPGGGVPPALADSIGQLAPAAIVFIVMSVVSTIALRVTGQPFADFVAILLSPLIGAVDSYWGVLFVAFTIPLLFWFGIHDSVITSPLEPFLYANLYANMAAYAAGTALPYTFTQSFLFYFASIGGNGATLALALLTLRSKSKQIKTIGRLGIVPVIFGVNEPIVFGLPVMYNPLMFIPSILSMVLNATITYAAMIFGLVGKTFIYPGWNLFSPVGAIVSTMDVRALVLVIALIALDVAVYYPFFKAFERNKLEEESTDDQVDAQQAV